MIKNKTTFSGFEKSVIFPKKFQKLPWHILKYSNELRGIAYQKSE